MEPDPDCVPLHDQLFSFPNTPLGFTIYRLIYKDGDSWARFMSYFQHLVHQKLEKRGEEALIPHLAWDVHSDPALEDASSAEVRSHFLTHLRNTKIVIPPTRPCGGFL
ncbi:hypothetical protein BU23DRAFT_562119 [Bimuria novae-zelandiae CBS 107.79]|uniref:Uncharacterized protein n=1 Tax=Bimuria novae-zelandiae CBS 107.79 TaxID=1447943 RepID=A0A6A5UHT3_9PLEO|nr:hypothetical protein BU23DRAFT_562119 [Bimuria novae-zelandiae CBS 107.79]